MRLMRRPSTRLAWVCRVRSAISNLFSTEINHCGHWRLSLRSYFIGLPRALNLMAAICFPLCLIFASFLLLLALPSNASSATSENHNLPVPFNSSLDYIIPHCYTPEGQETPGIKSTNLKACKDALAVLVRTPEFTTPFRFSRNPRAMAKVIPAGWQMGDESDCRIIINCQNDHDSAIFRYADIAQIAKRIIENCVDHPDPFGRYPLLKWGGVDGIKEAETFYVGVARPIRPALEVEVGNMTVVASGGLIGGIVESS